MLPSNTALNLFPKLKVLLQNPVSKMLFNKAEQSLQIRRIWSENVKFLTSVTMQQIEADIELYVKLRKAEAQVISLAFDLLTVQPVKYEFKFNDPFTNEPLQIAKSQYNVQSKQQITMDEHQRKVMEQAEFDQEFLWRLQQEQKAENDLNQSVFAEILHLIKDDQDIMGVASKPSLTDPSNKFNQKSKKNISIIEEDDEEDEEVGVDVSTNAASNENAILLTSQVTENRNNKQKSKFQIQNRVFAFKKVKNTLQSEQRTILLEEMNQSDNENSNLEEMQISEEPIQKGRGKMNRQLNKKKVFKISGKKQKQSIQKQPQEFKVLSFPITSSQQSLNKQNILEIDQELEKNLHLNEQSLNQQHKIEDADLKLIKQNLEKTIDDIIQSDKQQ